MGAVMSTNEAVQRNKTFVENIYRKGPFEGHAFMVLPVFQRAVDHPDYFFTTSDKPVANWVPDIVENYARHAKFNEAVADHSVPCARMTTGTHIYAAAFGCEANCYPDSPPCAVPLVRTALEADKLKKPDIWKSPSLYRVFELADALRKELGSDVFLGPPDMQSGFDTAALVWDKTGFLCAMADEHESGAVRRLVARCAALFKEFLVELRREFPNCCPSHYPPIWTPPGMAPWLSNDECGAFGVEMFESFCLPELIDLAETFGGLGMHCCADADHQFESFKQIPNLYALNRVPPANRDTSPTAFLPLLQAFSGPDDPVLALVTPAVDTVRFLLENAGKATRFIFVRPNSTPEEAREWLDGCREAARAGLS